ncbi:SycD/LcrH family type III secretion system chaperone [Waddlia chondrophila]|uniref:Putative type III secretion chaperone SycD/LcrH n=1 Tax=Waddlia chondrophila (strain ATCC VR-1470 / WSU 86-1044) TaxID=716544 RepID=D6YW12_WADCW|nr:SycD/LcrH family type III secretion system chaperone [Waddlia chondrophila]ADI38323.1 putative type III secretion chaperone SycD/LcrH [Waddlia chondrophila WSU 86-1044]
MTASLSEAALRDLISRYEKDGKPIPEFSRDTIEALYSFGYGFYQSAKYDQSIHFFRFLTLVDSNTSKHWMGLGAALQMSKQYHHAIQCFGYAAVLTPGNPLAPFHAAECFLSLGEHDRAAAVFDAAERIAKEKPHHYQKLLTRISLMHPGRKAHGE